MEARLRLAMKVLVLAAILLLLESLVGGKVPVSPSLVPVAIKKAFQTAHPTSREVHYALNVDDSGISYVIDYTVDGRKYESEYAYSEWVTMEAEIADRDLWNMGQDFLRKTHY